MSSLKSYIPKLAELVGMTPAALYERQRALVRVGLLKADKGRGPGSGVRATPEAVSLLLISILASGGLSDAAERTKAIGKCKPRDGENCTVSGATTFGEALTWALSSPENADKVSTAQIAHDIVAADIMYETRAKRIRRTVTCFGEDRFATRRPFHVEAFFHAHDVVIKIARDLQAFAHEGVRP